MKTNRVKEKITINKKYLKNCKQISLTLENCETFKIDIADVIDISCEAYKLSNNSFKSFYDNCYHTSSGYIIISGRAKDTLSDYAYTEDCGYMPEDYDEDEYKLYKRMAQFNDMCEFSLKDKSNRSKSIYVPYDALEDAVHRSEIDYANCPSFEICENGDMEIRFGKLSKNPIIPRNNYCDLFENWVEVLSDFNPKTLRLKVRNCIVEYTKDEESSVTLQCTILNKNRKDKEIIFMFYDCDKIDIANSGKINKAYVDMTKLCNGNIYFGIDDYFWLSCKSCKVFEDWISE